MESVQGSITVNAPIERCYEGWNNFESFPLFMKAFKRVTRQAGTEQWRWQLADAAGNSIEWDSRIVEHLPLRKIRWQSFPQEAIQSFGEVELTRINDAQTGITFKMGFEPKVYQLVAIPREELVWEALQNFKRILEGQAVKVTRDDAFGYGPFSEAGEPDLTGEIAIREPNGPMGPII